MRRWLAAGCDLVALKAGEKGCVLAQAADPRPRQFEAQPTDVVDSSGAGDAFNGGFFCAWLDGSPIDAAIEAGQSLARKTLAHQGAIEPAS